MGVPMSGVHETAEVLLRRVRPVEIGEDILFAVRGSRPHVGGSPHLLVTDRRVLGLTRLRGVEFKARPTQLIVAAYSDASEGKSWLTLLGPSGRSWTIGAVAAGELQRFRELIAPWLDDSGVLATGGGTSSGRTAQVFGGDRGLVRTRPPFDYPFVEFGLSQDTKGLLDLSGQIPAEERFRAVYPLRGSATPAVVVTDSRIGTGSPRLTMWAIDAFDEVDLRQPDGNKPSAMVVATTRDDLIDWEDEESFGPFELEHARQIVQLLRSPVPGPRSSGRGTGGDGSRPESKGSVIPVILDLIDEETGDYPSLMLRRYGLDREPGHRGRNEPTFLRILEDLLEWHVDDGAEVVAGDVIATFAFSVDVVAGETGILHIYGRSDDDPGQEWWNDRYWDRLDRPLDDTFELEIASISADPTVKPRREATSRPEVPRPGAIAIRSPEDAERAAAAWMRYWGWPDAEVTPPGADAGKDVDAGAAVAQVKAHMVPIGRPEIQNLFGVAAAEQKSALFFSLTGYTAQAAEWSEMAGVALFTFDLQGMPEPANDRAARIAHRRRGSGS